MHLVGVPSNVRSEGTPERTCNKGLCSRSIGCLHWSRKALRPLNTIVELLPVLTLRLANVADMHGAGEQLSWHTRVLIRRVRHVLSKKPPLV